MNTIPDTHRDLIDSPHTATLSTVGAEGTPQVTALWYLAEENSIAISVPADRQKYKNVVAHPKATLFIIDPANPFRTLEIRATTTTEPDPGLAVFERVVRHYGHDPDTFPAAGGDRVVLRLVPTRVVAQG
ncbi:PPOX class F420-dependent oxidoreductase [Nocardia africana]|uniref:PPOX class probable F420-dependent enzyme n=1 Tax=Nocardia africana TaxID=134964 RepID=A0A378WY93_9NOCA|nr:PPOX class F420-dependent oxidoreductase [Nocardia africana]MCC3312382.1 PPOX class F420-dependent oxidoreductase [Nocardia africana]SUA46306.1 PPOX class probable F420-dependent enzyme [Nocardia africana]